MNKLFRELGGAAEKLAVHTETRQVEVSTAPLLTDDRPIETDSIQEHSFNTDQVTELARTNLDFLAALCMPMVFTYCFPPVFISVWIWLLTYVHKVRDFSQLALGLPRGFGKTTLMKVFIFYCIIFTKKQFILVISHSASLAENIISDVVDMLDEPNVKRVFGDWRLGIEKDTQGLKKFGYRGRNIIIAGIGAGSSLRGLNIKNQRPDVMIFEDIQSREQAESEILSANLEKWMIGTAMKAKSPAGCMFIFVGNMYPTKHSILKKLKHNPTWTKFIAGGILADNTSLWEELQPISQLLAEYQNDLSMGRPEIFCSEVLNDENASSNNLIDFSELPVYPVQASDIPIGNFIVIDPSNDKVKSDAVSIGYFEIHDSLPVLIEIVEAQMSPGDTIRNGLTMALKHNCKVICIESNAYQYSLLYWFDFFCQQLGISGIQAVEIYSGETSKISRILKMIRAYRAGEIFVSPDCRAAVHLQITEFNPLRRDNTDGLLDLLVYAPRVVAMYGELIVSLSEIQLQDFNAIPVLAHNSCI
jgi:hypothetical protein